MKSKPSPKKSTALALPASIVPKPSRADLIEAMVQRAFALHAQTASAQDKIIKGINSEYDEEAKRLLNDGAGKVVRLSTPSQDAAHITVMVKSAKLTQLAKRYWEEKAKLPKNWDEKATRKAISDKIKGRVGGAAAILANSDTVRQIDDFLKEG